MCVEQWAVWLGFTTMATEQNPARPTAAATQAECAVAESELPPRGPRKTSPGAGAAALVYPALWASFFPQSPPSLPSETVGNRFCLYFSATPSCAAGMNG